MEIILMNFIDWKNLLLFIVLLVNIGLVFITYFKSKRRKINVAWGIAVGTVILWVISMIFYRSATPESALFWAKILHITAAFIPLAFLFFTFIFPENRWLISRKYQFLITTPTLLIILLIILPNVLIKEVIVKSDLENVTIWGSNYFLYVFYILGYFGWPLTNLFKKWRKYHGKVRSQIAYMLLGTSIAIFLGSIFNLLMPAFGYFELNWLGQVMTLFMVGFISYAIVAYKLFDIKVLLTQILVGIIAVLLLINLVVSESVFEYIWKGILFGTFLIFGYLLIQSVLQEIKRREKMERMSARLRKAYQELKKLDIAKSEFIAMASHQLRTPLSIIKGYVSMLIEGSYGESPEKFKKPLKNIFDSNERLVRIINDLLDISKVELGKLEVSKEEVRIEELINGVVKELKLEANRKNIELKWEKPEKPLPKIKVDAFKINQVIGCVLDNAIKYTKKGGVSVKAKTQNSKIRIIVSDTGVGMDKEDTGKIFQSFVRGAAGINLWVQGAGLGLYLAKKYVELHNGKIWAESPGKNKGSTFYIELPLK